MSELNQRAKSVVERMRKSKENNTQFATGGPLIKSLKADMFTCSLRDLAAVIQANPKHPVAASYRRAVQNGKPDNEVTIEKIHMEALIDNREIIEECEDVEVDVEGVRMTERHIVRKLGNRITEAQQINENAVAPESPSVDRSKIETASSIKAGGRSPSTP